MAKKEVAQLAEGRSLLKKAAAYYALWVLCQRTPVKYAWTKGQSDGFSIHSMCRFMSVSRSAYYDWLQRKPTSRDQVDSQLIPVIQSIFAKSRATYGTRRIRQSLEKQNLPVGRRQLGRLMRAAGLVCKTKRKFKATTHSKYNLPVADSLLDRNFTVQQANQVIKLMLATSLISVPKRAGYTWQLSSTCSPGKSWAGQWPSTCGHC